MTLLTFMRLYNEVLKMKFNWFLVNGMSARFMCCKSLVACLWEFQRFNYMSFQSSSFEQFWHVQIRDLKLPWAALQAITLMLIKVSLKNIENELK